MEFCVISPTAGLERYAVLSKTHLVLTHVEDPAYVKFYQERKQAGDFIILDNGAYEHGNPKLDHLQVAVQLYEPDVVVLPDSYLQPWRKTWHAAITWMDQNYDDISGFDVCYIPQSTPGDLNGFMQSYLEAAQDDRISWLGIPRCLATDIARDPLARVHFARMVRRDHPRLRLHAFGMCNGDVHELGYLAAAGVTSIDSSAPVWRGWNGYHIHATEESYGLKPWKDWPGTPVDFQAEHTGIHELTILNNLEACGVRISTRQRTAVSGSDVEDSPAIDDGSIPF